jgi:hypothetical protein
MSATSDIARERRTRIGLESAFGTTPAGSFPNVMTPILAIGDDLIVDGANEELLAVADERVRRDDNPLPVHGIRIASKVGNLSCYLKATKTANQLTAAGVAGSLTPRILLQHAMGAEHADVGTTISGTASTTTVLNVTSAATFKKGTFIAVQVGSEMEWAKVLDIDTGATPDTITIAPALSAAPATNGTIVRNLYNYAPAESHSNSLTVQQAIVGDSTAQWTYNGCYGDLAFAFEIAKLPKVTTSLTATNYTGPSSQGLSTAQASDEMGASFAWTPSVYVAANVTNASTVDRATRLPCESMGFERGNTWELVRDPGATQTVHSVVNVGGRPEACKATIRTRFDSDWHTGFTADTSYQIVYAQRIGTGTTASFWIVEVPDARLMMEPKPVKVGERLYFDLAFHGLQDPTVTLASETGTDLDLILATSRIAFG